jgi:hypothetical protein
MLSPSTPLLLHTPWSWRLSWPATLLGVFAFVFAVVALSSPGRIDIVDGQTRYEVARSLVDHGDSIIRDESTWFAVYKGRDGDKYSDYRIPQSALGVVAILLADATGPVSEVRRQFFFSLISPCMVGLLAVLYALMFRAMGSSPGASAAWAAAGIFCTPSWYYGTSTFDDILGTTAIVAAVAAMWLNRERRPIVGAVLASLAMAWAVNCKPPLAILALAVIAAGYRPQLSWRRLVLPTAIVGLGIVVGVVVYKTYHAFKFPPGSDDVFAEYAKQYGAWTTWNPLPGLASLALSPACGVLWYCPTLLLSWRGWRVWRPQHAWFCRAVVVGSLLFVLSVCFLPFFKGDPCWGPRYLTPIFALWWLFVPASLERVQWGTAKVFLGLGIIVQLLGLSVDPMRLFIQLPLPWNYWNAAPWLGFDGAVSHLVQRPRELIEVVTPQTTPCAEYNPGPIPTHAGCLSTGAPVVTSLTGLMAMPLAPGALNTVTSIRPTGVVLTPTVTQGSLPRYQIFNAPRPWVFNQWYLPEELRPVDMANTISFLVLTAFAGGLVILAGSKLAPAAYRSAQTPRSPSANICHASERDLCLRDTCDAAL